MEVGNKREIATILKQYKEGAIINYPAVMSIPIEERIPILAKKDFGKINLLIIGALTMAFESLNLKRGLNEIQILDLSEAIIDESEEDNLALEDIMLFLQNLVRGKYEISFENMNVPKFMEIFEIYRQERHEKLLEYKENKHLELKGLGSSERSYREDPLDEHFSKLGGAISELRESMRDLKKENNILTQAKDL